MRRALCTLLLLPIAAAVFCPIYGPAFPAPSSLAQSSTFRLALKNLTSTLDAAFASGNSSLGPVETTSANAIQVFSLNDDESPLYEYYRSGSILSPAGVQKVDGDSVMRIGSISKLITVYMVLAELGDKAWDFKITEVVPELKNWNRTEWEENPLYHVNWDEITLGSLAGHLSGIAVSVIDQGALGQAYTQFGLPQLPVSEQPACSYANNCTREEFFEQLGRRNPVHLPNTTPAYNGAGIMLLAYALESLTGKSYEQTLQSVLIEPLKLSGTSYSKPDDSKGVIPYNSSTSLWGFNAGTGTSQGGLYSSLNDLAKMGRSILGSSIIDKNTTRAWLKPTSFTSTMMGAVGRPWEIYRVSDTIPDHIVDLYTKGGDVGQYRSILALAPDYNIGFVVAVAGRGDHRWVDQTIIES
ncbi:beta-lactamase/transpeptidase-like protein, partial [Polyplosphaeria fusca]